jgi:hypothetical protein
MTALNVLAFITPGMAGSLQHNPLDMTQYWKVLLAANVF